MTSYTSSAAEPNSAVTGHAHPASVNSFETTAEALCDVNACVLDMKLDVVLRGLANADLPPTSAMVLPRVRRSAIGDGAVQHLDVVSCWKGLSFSTVLELSMWEDLFKESLVSKIKQRLQHEFVEKLNAFPDPLNKSLLVSRLTDALVREQPLLLDVSMPQLVHDMISSLYKMYRNETTVRRFAWSLSCEQLPNLVYNFIRTQDCFIHTIGGPYLLFDVLGTYTGGGLTVYADIHWQAPRITFSALPTQLSDGEKYHITPHHSDATLSRAGIDGFSLTRDETTYSLSKSPLALQWDPWLECFHGPVQYDIESHGSVLETVLSAKVTTPFHEGVRFERVSRYSIKLEVNGPKHIDTSNCKSQSLHAMPVDKPMHGADTSQHDALLAYQSRAQPELYAGSSHQHGSPWIPSYSTTPLSKIDCVPVRQWNTSRNNQDIKQEATDCQDDKTGQHPFKNDVPSCSHTIQPRRDPVMDGSSFKRKVCHSAGLTIHPRGSFALDKVQPFDSEVTPKRRKVDHHDDANDLSMEDANDEDLLAHFAGISTGLMGDAQSSPTLDRPYWSEKEDVEPHSASKVYAGPRNHTAALASNKRTSFTWRSGRPRCAALITAHSQPSTTDSSPTDETNTPATASSSSTEPLSQEQIQRNYMEFEQRKKQKAAEKAYYMATIPGFDGVVSPTDVHDKTFERIFMNNDDEHTTSD
ncbi:hypothetical protein BDU57DRAFT_119054 [Ampelomyces quisqualis]|uniref:Uncharacterized protein n=1 Tax=Ampelomyces quisqualis TaxID=50730 RepID=A0A6A5QST8_AMPQU|nr:hypothetical protein BDU57DRAFT_119054 [Ampelomyces quisqualis]